MKYLAYQTGGRYYFATDPSALPKIFIKEAKVVKRSLIFNSKFQPLLVLSTEITKGISADDVPPLMAYVATTPKPRALVPFVSDNENHDPVLAYWRYGLGKSVAFTSDATSNWGKHWVEWDKYKKLWTQTIRWASRKREKSNLRMHTQMNGGKGKLIIDAVDTKGRFVNFLKLNGRIVDPNNKGSMLNIRQTAPGRYEASFEADNAGVSIVNVGYQNPQTGGQGFAALGISTPYSPEYHKLESNLSLLRRAIPVGGGRILSGNPQKDRVFDSSTPAAPSYQPIWEYLLIAALFVFFFDVILRRVIITREDFATAFAAMRSRLSFKRKIGTQDETMAALLRRKQRTFEQVSKPSIAPQAFKKKLDKAAEIDIPAGENITAWEGESEERITLKKTTTKIDKDSSKGAEAEDEDSYTSRLLAAKKRAKKGEKY